MSFQDTSKFKAGFADDEDDTDEHRTLSAHRIMTTEEYQALNIKGWHMVCKDYDGPGGVGIRYISPLSSQQRAGEKI